MKAPKTVKAKVPKLTQSKGHVTRYTTRSTDKRGQGTYTIEYKDKTYKRKVHEGRTSKGEWRAWAKIDGKNVRTNIPGRST